MKKVKVVSLLRARYRRFCARKDFADTKRTLDSAWHLKKSFFLDTQSDRFFVLEPRARHIVAEHVGARDGPDELFNVLSVKSS